MSQPVIQQTPDLLGATQALLAQHGKAVEVGRAQQQLAFDAQRQQLEQTVSDLMQRITQLEAEKIAATAREKTAAEYGKAKNAELFRICDPHIPKQVRVNKPFKALTASELAEVRLSMQEHDDLGLEPGYSLERFYKEDFGGWFDPNPDYIAFRRLLGMESMPSLRSTNLLFDF